MAQSQPYTERTHPVNFTALDEYQAPFACPFDNFRLYMYNQFHRQLIRLPIKKLRPGISICHWAYVKFIDQAKRVSWGDISTKDRQRMFLIAKEKYSNKMFVVILVENQLPPAVLSNIDQEFERFLASQPSLLKRFFRNSVFAFACVLRTVLSPIATGVKLGVIGSTMAATYYLTAPMIETAVDMIKQQRKKIGKDQRKFT